MKNELRFFSEKNHRGNHAGTKARNDVEAVLHTMAARPVNSKAYVLTSDDEEKQIISNVHNRIDLYRLYAEAALINRNIIVIQYPILSFDFEYEYLKRLSAGNRLILLIHDLHSLRGVGKSLSEEISILNLAYVVLVHSEQMKKVLSDAGLSVPFIQVISLFDYLYPETGDPLSKNIREKQCHIHDKDCFEVSFAGNLGKSVFLKEAVYTNTDIRFHLYGSGVSEDLKSLKNAVYHGSYLPDVIPEKLQGDFGLVWDGESIDSCSGLLGEYLKINSPHKLSLYIAAGMPVIVWDKSAAADFVAGNKIGVCLDSIRDLDDKLRSVPVDEYMHMLDRLLRLRKSICTGEHLKTILYNAYKASLY